MTFIKVAFLAPCPILFFVQFYFLGGSIVSKQTKLALNCAYSIGIVCKMKAMAILLSLLISSSLSKRVSWFSDGV